MKKKLIITGAVAYLGCSIWLLFFFPYHTSRLDPTVVRTVNLKPFHTITYFIQLVIRKQKEPYYSELLFNVGGNIVLFIPLGMLFAYYRWWSGSWITILLTGAAISLAVESIQIFTNVGSFDVDDIILNALGTAIGFQLLKRMNLRKM